MATVGQGCSAAVLIWYMEINRKRIDNTVAGRVFRGVYYGYATEILIHKQCINRNFFPRTTGPISTKRDTKNSFRMSFQICSNEGPVPLEQEVY